MLAGFQEPVLARIPDLLAQAEDLTGSFFKISSFDPARYPFEIATLRGLDRREIVPDAFAQVSRYAIPNRHRPGRGVSRPLYRICLQDHNVLGAIERERGALAIDPLLLYVLTHELCHIVRFCDFQQLFEADESTRDDEEVRVHRLTHAILRPLKDSGVRRVLALYDNHQRPAN
jgi:hypothetical protein